MYMLSRNRYNNVSQNLHLIINGFVIFHNHSRLHLSFDGTSYSQILLLLLMFWLRERHYAQCVADLFNRLILSCKYDLKEEINFTFHFIDT
jgi:hypothetical protein